ncbi:MAG: hypothetical protein PHD95_02630 [Candidatus ainarchaeum sp.]|nr:hypothetical protein [Candidatus ainarchaeum sp.]
MVLCIVALLVFAVLGIWSANYRTLAKEAFRCVTRMVAFRPCDVQLETKIKAKVISRLMVVPVLAKFFYKNFKILSWIFTIAFFVSLAYSAYSIYNLIVFGTCSPGAPCAITGIAGICILVLEKYLVYGIITVFIIALGFLLLKNRLKPKKKD